MLEREPLKLLQDCGGYYECPPGGPLVGYAGTYELGKQYVGKVYVNFAVIERNSGVLNQIAQALYNMLAVFVSDSSNITGFCGAPEGGKALAIVLAVVGGKEYIFP